MLAEDHLLLAQYIVQQTGKEWTEQEIRYFIKGNLQPDKNLFTYFRGFFTGQRMRGHNYHNALGTIRHLCDRMGRHQVMTVWDFYLLGKLVHYVADAFTFPHNREFKENIKAHCNYEQELHFYIKETLKATDYRRCYVTNQNDLFQLITHRHEAYLAEKRCCETDCRYSLELCSLVVNSFLEKEADYVRKVLILHDICSYV